jgi:2-(1,2-epoxy-1,2-dihydrophenyl)acetyl-CoA isomerase
MPQPVVASVRGAVAGAALGFVAGADFVVCGESSIFVLAHVRIGACPDGASSYYLPRVLGVRKAKELAILGNKLSAEAAREFGLVNYVVPDTQVESATEELVKKIVDAPRRSVQWAKRIMNESLGNSIERQLQREAQGFGECAGSDDFAEGVSAFLEKRTAKFNRDGT